MRLTGKESFSNIALFVSDSFRHDTGECEFDRNRVLKTVSAGVSSPPSFASILTGQHPSSHGVFRFSQSLEKTTPDLFDLRPNPSFYKEGIELGKVLGTSDRIPHKPIDEVEPPFVYFERDLYPHAPYNHEWTYNEPVSDYCRRKQGTARDEYSVAGASSVSKFRSRVETLRERGLLTDTLVLFIADHGETFGEHGFYGHGSASLPELVYTPTVIYNDGVMLEEKAAISHIDLLPTLAHAVGHDLATDERYPGTNLFEGVRNDRLHFNQRSKNEWGVWDGSGGYVFADTNLLYQAGRFVYHAVRSPYAALQRQHPLRLAKAVINETKSGPITFGQPDFTPAEARSFAKPILKNQPTVSSERTEINKEHLADLGYVE